jgi:uncharacterized protein (TIGR03086 family)
MPSAASLTGAVALLERAVGYTRGSLLLVREDLLAVPTPCRRWDLAALLGHMYDSLQTMVEAAEMCRVELRTVYPTPLDPGDPAPVAAPDVPLVAALQERACALLGGWVRQSRVYVQVGPDALTPASIVAATGALEIAVHGWDVARACAVNRPIPELFAAELLDVAVTVITDADRGVRFAAPVITGPMPTPGPSVHGPTTQSDALLRFLGRDPAPSGPGV